MDILSLLIFLLFSHANSDVTTEGIVPLDDSTFDKVICHHTACIVLFQKKYAYGEKQKHFQRFAKKLSRNPNIMIAELGTSDWGKMENHSTRKRFYISTENYPVVLLFKKGDNQNPIKYKGDIEEKSLIAWLEEETSIVVDESVESGKIQLLAQQFVVLMASENKNNNILKEILETAEIKASESEEKLYVSIMKKIHSKGFLYLTAERDRIKGLLNQNIRDEQKLNFQHKLEVLKVFQKFLKTSGKDEL